MYLAGTIRIVRLALRITPIVGRRFVKASNSTADLELKSSNEKERKMIFSITIGTAGHGVLPIHVFHQTVSVNEE